MWIMNPESQAANFGNQNLAKKTIVTTFYDISVIGQNNKTAFSWICFSSWVSYQVWVFVFLFTSRPPRLYNILNTKLADSVWLLMMHNTGPETQIISLLLLKLLTCWTDCSSMRIFLNVIKQIKIWHNDYIFITLSSIVLNQIHNKWLNVHKFSTWATTQCAMLTKVGFWWVKLKVGVFQHVP